MKILVFLICLLGIVSAIQPKSKALPRFRQTLTVKHLLSTRLATITGCNAAQTAAFRSIEGIIPPNFDALLAAVDATVTAYRASRPQTAGAPNPTPLTRTDPVAQCLLSRIEGDNAILFSSEGSIKCDDCPVGNAGQMAVFPLIPGVFKEVVMCNAFVNAPWVNAVSAEERAALFGTIILHEFGHSCMSHWFDNYQHGSLENWDNGFFEFFKNYYRGQGVDVSGWRDGLGGEWGHECTENRECADGHFCCTTVGCGALRSHQAGANEILYRCVPAPATPAPAAGTTPQGVAPPPPAAPAKY